MKQAAVIILVLIVAFVFGILYGPNFFKGNNSSTAGHLNPQQFSEAISSGLYTLLDIRTADEYALGHLKNSQQIDYYQTQIFSDYLDKLDKNKKYLIYCRTGNRTGKALTLMKDKGFVNVSDLSGGITAWTDSGLTVEK